MAKFSKAALFSSLMMIAVGACDADEGDVGDEVAETEAGESEESGESGESGDSEESTTFLDDGEDDLMDFGEDSTGEPEGCAVHADAESCNAEVGCVAVTGYAIVADGREWCTAPEAEYIGCAEGGTLCPGFNKTVCLGEQAWQTNQCVPTNLVGCEGPGVVSGPCESAIGMP